MTLKIMMTASVLAMTAGILCGCSAVPPALQGKNTYGSVGRAVPGQPAFAGSSPTVTASNGRVIGADPDMNVRYELNRDSGLRVSPGSD